MITDDRIFHPVTGEPLYHIKGCRYTRMCSYPYCGCRVKHDKFDQPVKARSRGLAREQVVWLLIALVLAIFWGDLILFAWMNL